MNRLLNISRQANQIAFRLMVISLLQLIINWASEKKDKLNSDLPEVLDTLREEGQSPRIFGFLFTTVRIIKYSYSKEVNDIEREISALKDKANAIKKYEVKNGVALIESEKVSLKMMKA